MTKRIINLSGSPFAQFSAEEELEILDTIYYEPKYYGELLDLLSTGVSRFILGARGQGKSATIYKLFNDLSKNHTLPLLITRYDGIPLTNNENHLLYKIMQVMTMGLAKYLFENKKSKRKLKKLQLEKLSFFIELFYDPHCSCEFIESAKTIKQKKSKNRLIALYNNHLIGFLNTIINGTVSVTSDLIRQSIGLDKSNQNQIFKDYFHEFPKKPINNYSIKEVAKWEKEKIRDLITILIECAKALEFDCIVILFDKIDEFPLINGDIEKITEFTKGILTDTELLYSPKLSLVFSLWSEIKRSLNLKGIRFDKFKDIDIRWTIDELEPLINQRLKHFSIDKNNPVTLNILVPNHNDKNQILEISDHSPRSLISLLGEIYNEDHNQQDLISFTSTAISNGMITFCRRFDYESQNPSKVGKSNDLVSWINKILRIRKIIFSVDDLNSVFLQKTSISIKHIELMIKLGLIKEYYMQTPEGNQQYEVVNPKIKFLISRSILELDQ
jgi:hypothetical protein